MGLGSNVITPASAGWMHSIHTRGEREGRQFQSPEEQFLSSTEAFEDENIQNLCFFNIWDDHFCSIFLPWE